MTKAAVAKASHSPFFSIEHPTDSFGSNFFLFYAFVFLMLARIRILS
jgi:hypothetical protein